jgi:glycosyltransferase involved in cell wall biosynthesis
VNETRRGSVTRHLLRARPYPAKLSLVVPIYNEEQVLPLLREAIDRFRGEVHCATEVVLVNDGSSDGTLEYLAEWASCDPAVKVLHLSRNFGHQIAATAGLDHTTGDAVVLLDADLQDPLAVIHQMVERYCEGYDVAFGERESRAGESAMKRFTAWAFYRIMRALVYHRLNVDTGDFCLISRNCLDGLNEMRETHRFLRGMVAWVGYPQIGVKYHRRPRVAGSTKYPIRKMLAFAWAAATSFSTVPLRISTVLGIVIGLFAIEEGVRASLARLLGWYTVSGWTSLMVVTALVGSAMLLSIGVVGEYVAKLYEQAKGRPLYLVARTFQAESADSEASVSRRTQASSKR